MGVFVCSFQDSSSYKEKSRRILHHSSLCNDLCKVVRNGDKEALEKFLKDLSKEDVSVILYQSDTSSYQATALHWACDIGNVDCAQILLRKRAPVNALNVAKATPLHWACRNGSRDVVDLLVRYKADLSIKDMNGAVPATVAKRHGHEQLASLLQRLAAHQGTGEIDTVHSPKQTDVVSCFGQRSPSVSLGHSCPTFEQTTSQKVPLHQSVHKSPEISDMYMTSLGEVKRLETENLRLAHRLSTTEGEVTFLKSEVSSRDLKLIRMTSERDHASEEASVLRAHLAKAESSLAYTTVTLQQEQRSVSLERSHKERLMEQMQAVEQKLAELRVDAASAQSLRREMVSLQEKLIYAEKCTADLAESRRQINESNMKVSEDAEELHNLRSHIVMLQQQIGISEEERSSIAVLHDELATLQKKLQIAETYAKSVDPQTLQSNLGEAPETRIKELTEQVNSLTASCADYMRRNSALESEVAKFPILQQQLEAAVARAVNVDEMQLELITLRGKVAEAGARSPADEETVESREWQVEQKTISALRKELAELKATETNKNLEVEKVNVLCQEQTSELARENARLEDALKRYEAQLKEIQREMEDERCHRKTLEVELEGARQRIQELKSVSLEQKQENAQLEVPKPLKENEQKTALSKQSNTRRLEDALRWSQLDEVQLGFTQAQNPPDIEPRKAKEWWDGGARGGNELQRARQRIQELESAMEYVCLDGQTSGNAELAVAKSRIRELEVELREARKATSLSAGPQTSSGAALLGQLSGARERITVLENELEALRAQPHKQSVSLKERKELERIKEELVEREWELEVVRKELLTLKRQLQVPPVASYHLHPSLTRETVTPPVVRQPPRDNCSQNDARDDNKLLTAIDNLIRSEGDAEGKFDPLLMKKIQEERESSIMKDRGDMSNRSKVSESRIKQ